MHQSSWSGQSTGRGCRRGRQRHPESSDICKLHKNERWKLRVPTQHSQDLARRIQRGRWSWSLNESGGSSGFDVVVFGTGITLQFVFVALVQSVQYVFLGEQSRVEWTLSFSVLLDPCLALAFLRNQCGFAGRYDVFADTTLLQYYATAYLGGVERSALVVVAVDVCQLQDIGRLVRRQERRVDVGFVSQVGVVRRKLDRRREQAVGAPHAAARVELVCILAIGVDLQLEIDM